ncbi:hypothetical protein [Micromonospora sp. NPDC047740]|uniref:hypothetical protein n=1 Tax=Micromonospora sp. NPDC047740 TaxID=3364254 RepID=UPI0037165E6E
MVDTVGPHDIREARRDTQGRLAFDPVEESDVDALQLHDLDRFLYPGVEQVQ